MFSFKHQIDFSDIKGDRIVILIPGISGNSFEDERYNLLSSELRKAGISLFRFDLWKDPQEAKEKSIAEIEREIILAIEYVRKKGFVNVGLLGKSLGGAMVLIESFHGHGKLEDIGAMVLWSPFVFNGRRSNVEDVAELKLGEVLDNEGIIVDKNSLNHIICKTLFIHGDKDGSIPLHNSIKLSEQIKGSKVEVIKGADHSYTGLIDEVVKKTVDFFDKNLKGLGVKRTGLINPEYLE
jgi:dienelactone hydrolase